MSEYTREQMTLSIELGRLVGEGRLLNDRISAVVAEARLENMSWAKIGLGLGTTAQAAWERYGLTYAQQEERSAQQNQAQFGAQVLMEYEAAVSDVPDSGNVTSEAKSHKQA